MFAKVPERQMHLVRLLLTGSFLLLIYSLFYDPISPRITQINNTLNPLKIHPEVCIQVQGACLQKTPYALGAPLFWGIIVPSAILILLIWASTVAANLPLIISVPNSPCARMAEAAAS